ncbi:hypothetical protein F4823DRAFT_255898 [Ustulina deusta]|nr:hypothetical protein F4823DRAFT_255898 [Ustulina deusta]
MKGTQASSICPLVGNNDPRWFSVEQDTQLSSEVHLQASTSTEELPSGVFSYHDDQTCDIYHGVSFDIPSFEHHDPSSIPLPSFVFTADDECPPENSQGENSTILGCEAHDASGSPTRPTTPTFSSCTTSSSSVTNLTAVAQGCEFPTHSMPVNNGNRSVVCAPQHQNPDSQVLSSTRTLPSPCASTTVTPMPSCTSLERTTPALIRWQPIMPKPISGLNVCRADSPSLSKRKRPVSPLEKITRVDDCLIGVFSSGLNQNAPQQKRRRTPKACLRCQFDRKACSGGRPCDRCVGILGNIQSNKTIHWKYCVDSDILDGNLILPRKLYHAVNVQTDFLYSSIRFKELLVGSIRIP